MVSSNNLINLSFQDILQKIELDGWCLFEINFEAVKELNTVFTDIKNKNLFKEAQVTHDIKADSLMITPKQRTDLTYWLEPELLQTLQINILLNNLQSHLKNYFRVSLTHFETHLAEYLPGDYYKKHYDQTQQNNKRLFSFVIYLNDDWNEDFGGQLVGYDNHNVEIFKVIPEFGKMILFRSDIAHEVLTAHQARRSMTGWFRT